MFFRRTAVLLVAGFLLFACASPSTPAQNAGAQIIMNMESSQTVEASNISQIVLLHGNVTVAKPPKVPVMVSLYSTTDAGWNTQCAPDLFQFIDNAVSEFTCSVTVPLKTMNMTGTVMVTAVLSGHGLSDTVSINGTVTVQGYVTSNGTIEPAPAPIWLDVAFGPVSGFAVWVLFLVSTPTIIASTLTYFLWRRRKRKRASESQQ